MDQTEEKVSPSDESAASSPDEQDETAAPEEEEAEPRVTRGQAFARMLAVTIVMLAVLEILARIGFHVHRSRIDAAAAKDYPPNTYISDFTEKVDYRFINFYTADPARADNEAYQFDAFGCRLDGQNLKFDAPSPFKKIWMFGGSTVQGLGVSRDETIPAYLNRMLEADYSSYRVINMGQGGFTSTQELLLLIETLQSGFRPDAIISYDGATEIPFAGEMTKTGWPDWEKRTGKAKLLGDIQGGESAGALLPLTLSRMTKIDDVMAGIVRRMQPPASAAYADDNWDVVARRYLTTLNMMKSLVDAQKAPSLFFFQPIMEYEDHYKVRTLSPEEETYRPRMAPDEFKRRDALHADALADLRAKMGERFSDLHDVFRGHDGEKLYADPRHPNGKANGIIAARIYEEWQKVAANAR